jgi:hypothetical protein
LKEGTSVALKSIFAGVSATSQYRDMIADDGSP